MKRRNARVNGQERCDGRGVAAWPEKDIDFHQSVAPFLKRNPSASENDVFGV